MTNSLTLRRAGPQDARKLSLLGGAAFLESFASDHPGDALVEHCASEHSVDSYDTVLSNNAYAMWLLEEAVGAPVGYAMLAPAELAAGIEGDMELKRIYVLSRWHGQKYGAQLLDAVIREASARGAKRLILAVYSANHSARAFYARKGFSEIGVTTFAVGDVIFDDVVVARPL